MIRDRDVFFCPLCKTELYNSPRRSPDPRPFQVRRRMVNRALREAVMAHQCKKPRRWRRWLRRNSSLLAKLGS